MEDIQNQAQKLEDFISTKTGKKQDAYALATTVSAELGEMCDELIALEGDRIEDEKYEETSVIAKEIIDVIYNLLRIANHYNINLNQHWEKRLKQIKQKFESKHDTAY